MIKVDSVNMVQNNAVFGWGRVAGSGGAGVVVPLPANKKSFT